MAGTWVRVMPMRPFQAICAEARQLAEPAEFGGRDLAALEDWMAERHVLALSLRVHEGGGALVTLTRRSGQAFAAPMDEAAPAPAMASPLIAALLDVIGQVERADAHH